MSAPTLERSPEPRLSESRGSPRGPAGAARGTSSDDDALLCSFCGKSKRRVERLIAGPNVYICDECVELCNEILEEEPGVTQRLSRAALALERAVASEELFRDRHREAVEELLAVARELRAAVPKGEPRT